ncbi:ribosomal-protein-alanine N-acetyltransferase [Periweissella cryptocerci]|uniref:Ribosomal-protein-alanine N-acetyltransferase n=1 Tax=Periweissella cryptocerci TaxID=2506420 RepID=A0A4V1AIT0_9LACO|nr:ribosomal protein S18-alanine N-acetyltransferase [Periweissella cryptocerci]QBO36575.1 ribosomal-protein-alanine N-acetyltransferase [Periweissella cryptocerci]
MMNESELLGESEAKVTYREPLDGDELFELARMSYGVSPWSKQTFIHDLANQHASYQVILVNDIPAGFVAGTLIIDELSISNVAIIPAFQKQGLATKMMRAWLQKFPTDTHIFLEVRESNVSARRLYEKLGFTLMSTRKEYYRAPIEDALIMEMMLK